MQINLDIVIPMQCGDLNINVQDASGDRILAGDMLKRDATSWRQWTGGHKLESGDMIKEQEEDTHVGHVLGEVRSQKRKFKKTPRLRRGDIADSCRIFGSLEGNKVQGDFHITARGHGYMEFAQHLDHKGGSIDSLATLILFSRGNANTVNWQQHSTFPIQSTNSLLGPCILPYLIPSTKLTQSHPKISSSFNTTVPSSQRFIPDLPIRVPLPPQRSLRINMPSHRSRTASMNKVSPEFSSNLTLNLSFLQLGKKEGVSWLCSSELLT